MVVFIGTEPFNMLMHIFDHDDTGIDHRADSNRNTAQRHNVGVDTLQFHNGKGQQYANRQADQDHQRRSEMREEQRTHQHHDQHFFKQAMA